MLANPQSGRQVSTPTIVTLTGFMGAGKTSAGRALGALLRWTFLDLDQEIELRRKLSIREMFQFHGELGFRKIETDILQAILEQGPAPKVIALGGGTFVHLCNAELLRDFGAVVVFLETPIEQLLERCRVVPQTSTENPRPLATSPDTLRALYEQRLSSYRSADLTVNTAGKTAEEIASEIASRLKLKK